MDLKVINSNSSGNAYILEGVIDSLLIECGVKFKRIQKALNFDLSKVDACIVTHEHKDHSMAAMDVLKNGIPIIATKGTFEACKIVTSMEPIKHMKTIVFPSKIMGLPSWTVTALKVDHDAKEPVCYVIEHPECGRILFVTDTYVLRYKLKGEFDHVIIEANYCNDILEKWIDDKGDDVINERRIKNHMSFQTAKYTLEKMDLSQCKNIVLIHLSDGLTDEKRFKTEMESAFGIPTTVAAPGVKLNLSINPY